jgi:RNase P subunit RPR2
MQKAPWVVPQGLHGEIHNGGTISHEGVNLGAHATITHQGQVLAQLTHLWTLAHSTMTAAPQLSQHYMTRFQNVCMTYDVTLHPSVENAFCSFCGTLRMFGVNCTTRTVKVRPITSSPLAYESMKRYSHPCS